MLAQMSHILESIQAGDLMVKISLKPTALQSFSKIRKTEKHFRDAHNNREAHNNK